MIYIDFLLFHKLIEVIVCIIVIKYYLKTLIIYFIYKNNNI